MLTVRKIGVTIGNSSGLTAADYILSKEESPEAFARADYYAGGDEGNLYANRPNVIWVGSEEATKTLGVERGTEVERDELVRAMRGEHAVTGARLRRAGTRSVPVLDEEGEPVLDPDGEAYLTEEQRVNNVDLTCSAPKSVSGAWVMARAELKIQIEDAVTEAAQGALQYMVETKPVIQKTGETGRGFVGSAALHVTARRARGEKVPSPQLHVHGVIVGVLDGEGKMRTPDTAAWFKNDAPLEGGAVFRALLAERLRKIGFEISWGEGKNGRFFEIAGVPKGLVDHWSARSREVLDEIARLEQEQGRTLTGPELAAVALQTRQQKEKDLPAAQVIRQWHADARRFGFDRERVEGLLRGPQRRRTFEELREDAKAEIIARIWEQGPVVSAGRVRAFAYELAPMGFTLDQATELIDEMQRSGELIALEGKDGTLVTSREVRAYEEYVIDVAAKAARRKSRPLSESARARGTEVADEVLRRRNGTLDPEQRRAIKTLSSGAGWSALTGWAGTGKGPVLQAVAEAHRVDGFSVIACAIDGATAQRLGHQIQDEALTIKQVLHRVGEGKLDVNEKTLILIDEASKVGLEEWARIAQLVQSHKARLVAIGHTGQLGAIKLPGMFQEMLEHEHIPTETLREIRRHRDPSNPDKAHPWLGRYQVALDAGDGKEALRLLQENDAITMHETRADGIQSLVDGWDQRRRNYEDPRAAIMVIHGSNDDVNLVNKLAQDRRLANGELSGPGVQAVDANYKLYAGDVVMLREASYQPGPHGPGAGLPRRVENGTLGVVVGVDARNGRVRVMLDEPREPGTEGRIVEFDQKALADRRARGEHDVPALRLAYAFHPFPLQGATALDVSVLEGDRTQNKEGTYTANTRPVFHLHVHTDKESLGVGGSDEDRWERYITKTTTSQNLSSSLRMRKSDARIALDFAPSRPARFAERPRSVQRRQPVGRRRRWFERDVRIGDLVGPRHGLIGKHRARQISQRAKRVAARMRQWSDEDLHRAKAEGEEAFAAIDADKAREALRIENERATAQERAEKAEKRADQLEGKARAAAGVKNRKKRDDLRQEAETRRRLAKRDKDLDGKLGQALGRLGGKGQNFEDWMKTLGPKAADGIAAMYVLERRRELEIENAVREAITKKETPKHIAELAGDAPLSGKERAAWEDIVERIERHVHARPAESSREAKEAARAEAELARRIDRYRDQRNLERQQVAETLQRTRQSVEVGV